MTQRKVYNIVKPHEYVTSTGENKTHWSRHGILIIDGDKVSLRLDSVPTGDWNGWLNCFEKKDINPAPATNRANPMQHYQSAAQPAEFVDDIPF